MAVILALILKYKVNMFALFKVREWTLILTDNLKITRLPLFININQLISLMELLVIDFQTIATKLTFKDQILY